MEDHFEQFARYNGWANARLYEAALALGEDDRIIGFVETLDDASLDGEVE